MMWVPITERVRAGEGLKGIKINNAPICKLVPIWATGVITEGEVVKMSRRGLVNDSAWRQFGKRHYKVVVAFDVLGMILPWVLSMAVAALAVYGFVEYVWPALVSMTFALWPSVLVAVACLAYGASAWLWYRWVGWLWMRPLTMASSSTAFALFILSGGVVYSAG